jgi:hypothetical protein
MYIHGVIKGLAWLGWAGLATLSLSLPLLIVSPSGKRIVAAPAPSSASRRNDKQQETGAALELDLRFAFPNDHEPHRDHHHDHHHDHVRCFISLSLEVTLRSSSFQPHAILFTTIAILYLLGACGPIAESPHLNWKIWSSLCAQYSTYVTMRIFSISLSISTRHQRLSMVIGIGTVPRVGVGPDSKPVY